jgi:predicted DNA binding protein
VVSTHGTECLCEVSVTDPSIVATAAEHGGTVTTMAAEDGGGTVGIELPRTTDLGRVLGALEATVADVELQSKRTVDRPIRTEHRFESTVTDRLTDRQRDTLEAAYLAGLFETPRRSTGEAIAESMGVSSSTFHQHLRASLRKLVGPIVET